MSKIVGHARSHGIAYLALFAALGGGTALAATKIPKNSVGTKQLKANAVVSSRVKNGSLLSRDFKRGQLPAGPRGATGAPGPQGAKGDTGPQGPPGPSTGSAGGALSGSYPNPAIADGAVTTAKFGTIPAARYELATKTVSNDDLTEGGARPGIQSADFDTDGLHQGTSNSLIAPIAGSYMVTASVVWATNGTGDRALLLTANTNTIVTRMDVPASATGDPTTESVSSIIHLDAGGTLQTLVRQDSGADLDMTEGSLAMAWLGP
jgi:hypothetical protein